MQIEAWRRQKKGADVWASAPSYSSNG